jgi:enhancing lycopene biosynthesis protein 2
MKKIAVILSGCGTRDGSEIHESTLSLLAIDMHGCKYQCFAPDRNQTEVVNHFTQKHEDEKRNMLAEAARIARCDIKPLSEINASDFDALWIPGGLGAAKNLCSYFYDGANMKVDKEVESAIIAFNKAGKPIVALCIAPVIVAKVLEAKVTSGKDANTAAKIEAMGGKNIVCNFDEIAYDEEKRVITAPCYMLDATIAEIWRGIDKAAAKLVELI